MKNGRCCANCGFLTKNVNDTTKVHQISWDGRRKWRMNFETGGPRLGLCNDRPMCFADEKELQESLDSWHDRQPDHEMVGITLTQPRSCESFFPYMQGYDPKEHHAMHLAERQKEMDLKWQAEQRQRDKESADAERLRRDKWEEERRADDRKWQVEQKWKDRKWAVVLLLLGSLIGYLLGKPQPLQLPPAAKPNEEKKIQPATQDAKT